MKTLKSSIQDYFYILLGTLLQAVALHLFFLSANLATGGVAGIAQMIHHYTNWPIGLMVFIGNLPLFGLGWRYLGGRRFVTRTAVAIISYSLFVDLLPPFMPADGLTEDLVLNALYGAVVAGIGYGLVYRGQGTSGGSDILARILNRWRGVPMTQSYLMVDTLVILSAGFVFGWEEALYAVITLYVSGIVAETTFEGRGMVRTALLVTSQPEAVARQVLEVLQRGVTIVPAIGGYTGEPRSVLYCVVSRSEIVQLKTIVQEIDPRAFMVVGQAYEALGEGFRPLDRLS
ncbi:MAG TPA: YitT family protein [Anaerolineales bacterium]|nr:YitT family protein [Anaerolineales bacterium]